MSENRRRIPLGLVVVAGLSVAAVFAAAGDRLWPQAESDSRGGVQWLAHPDLPFDIIATEVSVAQFKGCLEAGACEASTVSERCNLGQQGREAHPVNCVSYPGAEQFCGYVGGRICAESEWLEACSGTDQRAFPYGPEFIDGACNVASGSSAPGGPASLSTVEVGSLESCAGGLPGLHDMAGNVAEWVAECKGDYCKFRGAGYMSNDPIDRFAGCTGVCSGNDKSLQSGVVGIRCCRDRPAG